MGIWGRLFSWSPEPAGGGVSGAGPMMPHASFQPSGGGTVIMSPEQLAEALRHGLTASSGVAVTPHSAMGVAAVYGCVRLISGAVATLPLDIKRRVDARTREDASDHPLWTLLRRRPNRWQKPAVFRRMMQAAVLLRGNAYALKVLSARGQVVELIPLDPDRVEIVQADDLSLSYKWTNKAGRVVVFAQAQIMHLCGLTLDGVRGVTPITYARETIGFSLAMERHGSTIFKNGLQASGILKADRLLSEQARENLKASMAEYRAGGGSEGASLVLEEGLDYKTLAMTSEDAQWVEARKLSRSDVCMFFGVPPSMIGDNSGSDSNWGTGLEQKSNGFATYCLDDHLVMWEEAIGYDCIPSSEPTLYARFNRAGLAKGDIKTRWDAHVKSLQWGVCSPNEIRAIEDMNPRDGGDVFYDPPNTAGQSNRPDQTTDQQDVMP